MRIVTVIYSMGCGGAERVMASLANAWAARDHEVVVVTLKGEPSFYPLSSLVKYTPLAVACPSHNLAQRCIHNLRRLRQLRRTLRDLAPDVIVSFLDATNVLTLLTSVGVHAPVIVCEHNDPSQRNCRGIWGALRVLTYPFADAVTLLTEGALSGMRWLVGERGVVIPNPIEIPDKSESLPIAATGQRIVAIGRLYRVKGFDYLLDAFQRIAGKHADWTLTILGEGPLRSQLEDQIERLGLSGRVELHGQVNDPFRHLRTADLFVMSSRFEAFPCALMEAMACGVPAISFDCPSGPRSIIHDGEDGVLVPAQDVRSLASAMDRLMSDPVERQRLAARAPDVLQQFSVDSILHRWDELFVRVGACPHLLLS